MLKLKDFYSVQELFEFHSQYLPSSIRRIKDKAERENWESRKRVGKGGGKEYALSSMPQALQDEIRNKFAVSIVKAKPKSLPADLRQVELKTLTEKQREVAGARMALVAQVAQLEQAQPRYKAIKFFCEQIKHGGISSDLMRLVEIANNKKGKNRTLSDRTLNQWVLDYEKADTPEERLKALAPMQRVAKKAEEIVWLPDFLAIYRQTNGINVAEAYHYFSAEWDARFADEPLRLEMKPSIDQVRAALAKLPKHIKEIGRKTGSELRALNTYVKRHWSVLQVNDVWVGDGHAMKLKVAHPEHGRPFIPEVTLIMDASCRFIVGWSASLAENVLAVADALRYGVERYGIPAIYYSDNGGGEKNWMLDGDITGMLPRLGIKHQTGIPGNPQGRGIIERVHQTILYKIARQFETYHGTGADKDTVRQVSTAVISLDKAKRKGATQLTPKQQWAVGKLPSWNQFLDAVQAGVDWYNNEHVHSEIGMTPAQKRRQLMEKMNPDDLVFVTPVEARDLFRPSTLRVAQRGWLQLFNNYYFSTKLLDVDGQKVQVMFDIHDPSQVIVRKQDGTFVCYAELDGNKRDAFPMPFVEKTRQERHARRAKLKQEQLDEINAELNPIITIEHQPDFAVLVPKVKQKIPAKPIFHNLTEKEEWEAEQAKLVNE
ncbi:MULTISPECIES: Mu transposase C-terminal domain-containing protein [Haemophilus]|uniref:Phage transposase n=3 Tax=Haemophilus TaxID=724 RepID=A0AAV2U5B1_HAEIF|nr:MULTISPECIES: Mu transposase C-terminal domain-containing protein [Haemophilus]OBX84483.1 transposase [Haemophilus aegyptius]UAK83419.1 Mu transposase C-terminal domain-containing protein [Haemophilus aegyptius]CBY87543.1 Phage transposase [Haemophilus influenzae F3047]SQH37063.1 phage transposase [Haemophilus aegyptius]VEH52998.1 phage transposase [Haemophilus aegyptius]